MIRYTLHEVAGYKMNTWKSVGFLLPHYRIHDKELREMKPFTIIIEASTVSWSCSFYFKTLWKETEKISKDIKTSNFHG